MLGSSCSPCCSSGGGGGYSCDSFFGQTVTVNTTNYSPVGPGISKKNAALPWLDLSPFVLPLDSTSVIIPFTLANRVTATFARDVKRKNNSGDIYTQPTWTTCKAKYKTATRPKAIEVPAPNPEYGYLCPGAEAILEANATGTLAFIELLVCGRANFNSPADSNFSGFSFSQFFKISPSGGTYIFTQALCYSIFETESYWLADVEIVIQ
jgi:hypothetical protein